MIRNMALGLMSGLLLAGPALAGDEPKAKPGARAYAVEWQARFAEMSPEGRAIIAEAMRRDRIPANAKDVKAARDRVLDLLEAERLDVDAIRKAQAAERMLAIKEHEKAQEKMVEAYKRLSLEDRRAFAELMRSKEERMLRHMQRARARMDAMQEQFRQDMERMKREMQRVSKETGFLVVVPPVPLLHFAPQPPAAPAAPADKSPPAPSTPPAPAARG
jgi:uncharacterized membrane protein